MRIVHKLEVERMIVANATRGGVAVAIGRDNHAPIKIVVNKGKKGYRTRHHLAVDRFNDLIHFLIHEKLASTPVGKKHLRNGTRMCRSFEEFRRGEM